MTNHNQDGAVNGLAISFIFTILLLIGAIVFGLWAFGSRQDYKNNVNAKISVAVNSATQNEETVLNAQYAKESEKPLTSYEGPQAYGSIIVNYPKTWSAYVDDTGTGTSLVNGYFNPGHVPSITSQSSVFALRVQVLNQSYAQTLQSYSNEQNIQSVAYALPSLPKVVGVELTGELAGQDQQSETMVILPLRADTLEIWTQGTTYLNDFNTNILPNLSFSP
jgi:hypothetical protein